ncbi:DUF4097 family beta strand repeat-containing protein [Streptomonospora algeriensis]|uniref:DUF4097 family beta strand repeat-containing protein n=1 Tax=Streptomonospora algeriensis TaxID=995084 RepID=A0ABW3BI90_9ACTN
MTFTGRGLYAKSSKVPRGRRSGWLLIGAVVALAVLVFGALASFDSVQLGGGTRSDSFSGAEKVEVRSGSAGDIDVHRAEGDKVTVERTLRGTPLADPRERLDREGGTVRAEASCSGAWFLGGCEIDYTVGVPEGTEVTVVTSVGEVHLEGLAGDVDVESNTGSVEGEDIAGDVSVSTSTGEISLSGVSGDVDLDSNTGGISAEGSGESAAVETTTGGIDLDGFTADRFDVETTTGGVDMEAGFSTAEIKSTTGGVDVEAEEPFGLLAVETTTGSVELEVPEDTYRVSGDSTTGGRNIDVDTSADADPRISVSTTTGSVSVSAD